MSGHLRAFCAEFIGTFVVVWLAAGAASFDAASGGHLGFTGVALAYGLALALMTWTFAEVSGAHFNPAITAASYLAKKMDGVKASFYLVSQLFAAALAGLLLSRVFNAAPNPTLPPAGCCSLSGIGFRMGTLLESMAAFCLALSRFSAPDGASGRLAALQGGAVCAAALAIGPLTGAAVNPARAFGTALATGYWTDWFVYWVGPFVGASAGAIAAQLLFVPPQKTP